MITIEKLKIFEKYKGDKDLLLKIGTDYEEEIMDSSDFFYIENALQDIHLIKNGLVAQSYKNSIIEGYKNYMDNATMDYLFSMKLENF